MSVIELPGVQRLDTGKTPVATVLQNAASAHLVDVVIVGVQPDGKLGVWSSDGNADAVIGQLFQAATLIQQRELGH